MEMGDLLCGISAVIGTHLQTPHISAHQSQPPGLFLAWSNQWASRCRRRESGTIFLLAYVHTHKHLNLQAIDKLSRTARRTIDTHVKNVFSKPRLSTSIRRMSAMFNFAPDPRECITISYITTLTKRVIIGKWTRTCCFHRWETRASDRTCCIWWSWLAHTCQKSNRTKFQCAPRTSFVSEI
jgi:hypothetical protein